MSAMQNGSKHKKPGWRIVIISAVLCLFVLGFGLSALKDRTGRLLHEQSKDIIKDSDDLEGSGYELGFITEFCENDASKVLVQPAEWIIDKREPNGFRIEKPDAALKVYTVDDDTNYYILHYHAEKYAGVLLDDNEIASVTKDHFAEYMDDYNSRLFWVKEENGVIVNIIEQYVP